MAAFREEVTVVFGGWFDFIDKILVAPPEVIMKVSEPEGSETESNDPGSLAGSDGGPNPPDYSG